MATGLSNLLIAAPVVLSCGMIGGTSIYAQVETDGTVGPRLQLDGPEFAIRADLGARAGRNLFHSFERFSLGTGERATFTGPNQIRNVLSRVTGGERSDIDGTLGSTIPGADFFFINPAGVTFGPNATLDVQGSFHVSTADELRFSDGAKFSATNPGASSLTIAAPEAFGFLGADHAAITVNQSTLEVPRGEAFSIVGGDITIDGGNNGVISGGDDGLVRAAAGTIHLLALDGPGAARIDEGEAAAGPTGASIALDLALVDASGDGGGTVRVRGGNFVVDRSLIDASNFGDRPGHGSIDVRLVGDLTLSQSLIGAGSSGSGSGGTVEIAAANITLSEGLLNSNSLLGAGNAGSVTVTADRLTLLEGSQISSSTGQGSTGAGGEVQVTARESLLIAGRNARDGPSGIFASTEGAANSDRAAGNVTVTAGDLEIRDGGQISSATETAGDAGAVTVTVTAGDLEIRDGLITSSTLTAGDAGSVTVTADRLTLLEGGIFASAEGAANGAAGNVTVTAGTLELRDGLISSVSEGAGDAGRVLITADDLTLRSSVINSSSFDQGDAGSIVSRPMI